jgi:hypothetical protein
MQELREIWQPTFVRSFPAGARWSEACELASNEIVRLSKAISDTAMVGVLFADEVGQPNNRIMRYRRRAGFAELGQAGVTSYGHATREIGSELLSAQLASLTPPALSAVLCLARTNRYALIFVARSSDPFFLAQKSTIWDQYLSLRAQDAIGSIDLPSTKAWMAMQAWRPIVLWGAFDDPELLVQVY